VTRGSSTRLAVHGGSPVRTRPWPTYDQGTGPFSSASKKELLRALNSGRLFRYDSRDYSDTAAGRLELALATFFDTRYALAVSSGTAALTLAILGLDLAPGSEVACPAFGFPATASAVMLAGAKPRVVGVDRNLHFDLPGFMRNWTDKIQAIIVVHMRGFASPIESIVEFAGAKGVPVVEDAVPALGARRRGRLLGTFGNVGCFSTQSDKTINTGEGGFLITDNRKVYERALLMSGAFEGRYRGHVAALTEVHSEFSLPLFNFRIDELRAALALSQIQEVDTLVAKLGRNYDYVTQRISELPGLRLREPVGPGDYLGDSLVFFTGAENASLIATALRAEGIRARSFDSADWPNVRAFWNWEFIEADLRSHGGLNISQDILCQAIDIPLSPRLEQADLEDLVRAIGKVMNAYY
jgi:dTDP-4-amino-4,6-dideoxygalactose transaminase